MNEEHANCECFKTQNRTAQHCVELRRFRRHHGYLICSSSWKQKYDVAFNLHLSRWLKSIDGGGGGGGRKYVRKNLLASSPFATPHISKLWSMHIAQCTLLTHTHTSIHCKQFVSVRFNFFIFIFVSFFFSPFILFFFLYLFYVLLVFSLLSVRPSMEHGVFYGVFCANQIVNT